MHTTCAGRLARIQDDPGPSPQAVVRNRPRLSVGFILAKRFTLCAFANFVHVLAARGRRGLLVAADPVRVGGPAPSTHPPGSLRNVAVSPSQTVDRLGDPTRFRHPNIVVVGWPPEEYPEHQPRLYPALLQRPPPLGRAARRPLHRRPPLLHRAGLTVGLPRRRLSPRSARRRLPGAVRRAPAHSATRSSLASMAGDRLTCAGRC